MGTRWIWICGLKGQALENWQVQEGTWQVQEGTVEFPEEEAGSTEMAAHASKEGRESWRGAVMELVGVIRDLGDFSEMEVSFHLMRSLNHPLLRILSRAHAPEDGAAARHLVSHGNSYEPRVASRILPWI